RRTRGIADLGRHQRIVRAADAGVRITAENVVVPQAALYRQTAGRPLILPVERSRHEVADEFDGRRPRAAELRRLRELIRDAAAESVLNERREVVVRLTWVAEAPHVADLHVVRPGDVRNAGPEVGQRADLLVLERAAERVVE